MRDDEGRRGDTIGSAGTADTAGLAAIFAASGEMGTLITRHDWTRTPLGSIASWPAELVGAAGICLQSRFPMIIFWGPEFIQLYNDAYRPILGAKHPTSLGQPARQCWPELWDVVGPMLHGVLERGEATFSTDLQLVMDRHDYPEETFFTFSYSPMRDRAGEVTGVFCAVVETTERVVGERRLGTLRELAARTADAHTADAACQAAATALRSNPDDVPFALFYLLEPDGAKASLVAATGRGGWDEAEGTAAAALDFGADGDWPLAEVVRTGEPILVDNRPGDRAGSALVLPISQPGADYPAGLLVVGVNPRRALDDSYRGFFQLIAGNVANAVAEARAYELQARRAEALAEIDRVKTAFFSNVSHEFRTPLTLMLGPLEELIADEDALPAPHRDRLHLAYRNALRLLRLVNTLLNFSRLEAGRAELSFSPVDLSMNTAELASMFRSAVEQGGLVLSVDCPPLPTQVYVDVDMWEDIVLNLISNAFKYTFTGRIDVALREVDGMAELTVRDTGVGIHADQIPHLFERFHRVPGVRARTHEGTGIGLSLVSELVALHGGTVSVSSEAGIGSVFTVRIPLGSSHLPPDRIGVERPVKPAQIREAYVEEALLWLPDGHDERATADLLTTTAAPVAPEHAVVLVVDDNADMRAHIRRALSPFWTVRTAPNGEAALRMARTSPPDVVVTDVMMPGLDGFGMLREMRADPHTREVPVIVLSARAGQESTLEGLAAGADDYLVKPFTTAELVARVRTHLRTARARQRAALRMRSLATASHALATSLDADELVDVMSTLVIPQWADDCVIWLRERTRTGEWRIEPRLLPERDGRLSVTARSDPEGAAASVGVPEAIDAGRAHQSRLDSGELALTLPLRARGATVGALTAVRSGDAPWRPTDLEYLSELGGRLALALDNAARFQAEHSVAITLQRSLLPSELPALDGVGLAARYQPGGQGTSVGGDWYDAFPLDGGVALAIGDVMGRGVRAAAIMGQLRAALRGYALENLPPAQLLTRLDAFVEASGEPHLSTCLYATYTPDTRQLRIAGAGHLPPLLITPDGTSRHIELPVGLPLGVGTVEDITYADIDLTLDPGSLLLFYTDGLIESRQQSLDAGMRALEAATRRTFPDAEVACDHILSAMGVGGDNDDDTTLLVICIEA